MTNQVKILASWQLMAELARRHPDLWLVETQPAGGQYDCLWLCSSDQRRTDTGSCVVSINREGSLQVEPWWSAPDHGWLDLLGRGATAIARDIEQAVRLSSPERAPQTNRRTLTYRIAAGLVAFRAAEEREGRTWDCRSGCDDDAVSGYAVREHHFAGFPSAAEALRNDRPSDLLGLPGYRFWFLLADDRPVLALETSARAWTIDGHEVDLMRFYDGCDRDLRRTVVQMADQYL